MSYGLIYCATNKINNKKYIGQTTHTLDWRKGKHEKERGKAKKVICLETGEIFSSTKIASEKFGISRSFLGSVLQGRKKPLVDFIGSIITRKAKRTMENNHANN